jgi:hypothetical protein
MRRWLGPLVLLFTLALLCFYPLLAPTPHRIDRVHFDLVEAGMTQADVEAIFGVPAGQYDWAEPYDVHFLRFAREMRFLKRLAEIESAHAQTPVRLRVILDRESETSATWIGRHGGFDVSFDAQGRVVSNSGPYGVRVVPPWQRWWQTLRER